ncbi:hypothetical protein DXG03_002930 [Asterophora parasitica]|uniref:RRM domain-containing protein n=1 Tax=Asterophora parasitica TaxID=117018 RepID=A0A9P7GB66_9AGAR|nr:hypothetical protein DXG03_002930 [Asterophora parasitica]
MRVAWSAQETNQRSADTTPVEGRHNVNTRPKTRASTQRKRVPISQQKRVGKHRKIQDARKREEVKANVDKSQTIIQRNYPFVYVGNVHAFFFFECNAKLTVLFLAQLKSTITEARLEELFASCGEIHHTSIRCSRGQAVTVGTRVPDNRLTSRDRQYASVEFKTVTGAKKALTFNGKCVDGVPIVVVTSPADLPEVKDIVHTRIEQTQENKGLFSRFQRKLRSKPVAYEPTEEYDQPSKTDVVRIFGYSIRKTIA